MMVIEENPSSRKTVHWTFGVQFNQIDLITATTELLSSRQLTAEISTAQPRGTGQSVWGWFTALDSSFSGECVLAVKEGSMNCQLVAKAEDVKV